MEKWQSGKFLVTTIFLCKFFICKGKGQSMKEENEIIFTSPTVTAEYARIEIKGLSELTEADILTATQVKGIDDIGNPATLFGIFIVNLFDKHKKTNKYQKVYFLVLKNLHICKL